MQCDYVAKVGSETCFILQVLSILECKVAKISRNGLHVTCVQHFGVQCDECKHKNAFFLTGVTHFGV